MATETSTQPPTGPFTLVYDDGDTHHVTATNRYPDGSFTVRPIGNTDPFADWTVYPTELHNGVARIEA